MFDDEILDFEETETVVKRTRAFRRRMNVTKALRKKHISDNYGCFQSDGKHWYNNLHQYSKNKIHCSCPLCRAKTNNKSRKSSLAPHYNPKPSQMKKDALMNQRYKEYLDYGNEG